jgi:SRSO17 transposase
MNALCRFRNETGDLKKGTATAGVQRPYTGTAGRIENAQVAVYLGYASAAGHALVDRELCLPRSWTSDRARCATAGIPEDTAFATKPELAWRMIGRALTAGYRSAGSPDGRRAGSNYAGRRAIHVRHQAAR